MRLWSDWDSVFGVIRLYRETENGEWRMRLQLNSSPFSILHSPFSIRHLNTTPFAPIPAECVARKLPDGL